VLRAGLKGAVGAIMLAAVLIYVIAQAGRIIGLRHANGIRSVTAGIPLALMYASMPLGFGSGVLFLLARLRRDPGAELIRPTPG
jgi:TRAP-type C4-dicarboxylate transport system permease small subunit